MVRKLNAISSNENINIYNNYLLFCKAAPVTCDLLFGVFPDEEEL